MHKAAEEMQEEIDKSAEEIVATDDPEAKQLLSMVQQGRIDDVDEEYTPLLKFCARKSATIVVESAADALAKVQQVILVGESVKSLLNSLNCRYFG